MITHLLFRRLRNWCFQLSGILLVLTSLSFTSSAQLSGYYNFYQGSAPYAPISSGTLLGSGSSYDNQVHAAIPIGFTFTYNGTSSTTIGLSSNGFAWLGATNPAITNYTPISTAAANTGFLAPYGRNIEAQSTGELRYSTIGVPPNRIFIAQWKGFQRTTAGTANNAGEVFNFQLRLYEFDYSIVFSYGTFTTTTNGTAQVGLRGTTNSNYMNRAVTAANNWASSVNGATNTATALVSSANVPVSGQYYQWIPKTIDTRQIGGGTLDTISSAQPAQGSNSSSQFVTSDLFALTAISNASLNMTINGALQPVIPLTQISGTPTNGSWSGAIPPVTTLGDVTYYPTFETVGGDRFNGQPLAYEIGYLRVSGPTNLQVLQNPLDPGAFTVLKADASISNVKFSELLVAPNASSTGPTAPFITNLQANDYLELTNLGLKSTDISGFTVEVLTGTNTFSFTFPEGTKPDTGKAVVVRIGHDGTEPLNPTALFFETPGTPNSLNDYSQVGCILRNRKGEVVDAFAVNGFEFPSTSGVTISKWFGGKITMVSKSGIRRTSSKDHNSIADWGIINVDHFSSIGNINYGLEASIPAPTITWYESTTMQTFYGESIQFPITDIGNFHFDINIADGAYSNDGSASLIVTSQILNPPVADFIASKTNPKQFEVISLTDLSTQSPLSWQWSITPGTFVFVNGTSATSQNPQVKFNQGGTYSVSLTSTNADGSDTELKTNYITVTAYTKFCSKPTGLCSSSVTQNSAVLSWDPTLYADSFQVAYRKSVCYPFQYVYVAGGGSNSVTLTNLNSGSCYEWKVRSICYGVPSSWSSTKYFYTSCGHREMQSIESNSEELTIQPNPATHSTTILIPGYATGECRISVYDYTGKLITSEIATPSTQNELILDVTYFKPAIYLLVIENGTNIWKEKLVKQ